MRKIKLYKTPNQILNKDLDDIFSSSQLHNFSINYQTLGSVYHHTHTFINVIDFVIFRCFSLSLLRNIPLTNLFCFVLFYSRSWQHFFVSFEDSLACILSKIIITSIELISINRLLWAFNRDFKYWILCYVWRNDLWMTCFAHY